MPKATHRSARKAHSPESAARHFVQGQSRVTIGELIERDGQGWKTLTDAIRSEYERDALNLHQRVALEEQLQAALPKKLQAGLVQLLDAQMTDQVMAQEAGFIVGLMYGRSESRAR